MNEQMQRGYDFAKTEINSGYASEIRCTLESIARERELDDYDLGVQRALHEQAAADKQQGNPQ